MQQNNKPKDEAVITLSDLVHIFKTHRTAIAFGAIFCCLLAACFALSKPVVYNIEGTFKDKGKANSGVSHLSMLLNGGASQTEGEAMATIKSRKFMEKLIHRRGLQAVLLKMEPRFDLFGNIPENLIVEHAHFWGLRKPVLPDNPPQIWLQDIAYNDELPRLYTIHFMNGDNYDLRDSGHSIGQGELGKKFIGHDFAFTILRKSDDSLEGTSWVIELQPLQFVSDTLLAITTIESDKYDKNLLHIKLNHPNRHTGTEILNSMMLIYQEHIRQEQKRIAKEQISYLEKRQREMGEKLRGMMLDHAKNMSSDMVTSGFLNSLRAIEFFSAHQTQYQQKLYDIELTIKRLNKAQEENYAHYDGIDPGIINHTLAEIRSLKQQSDTLDLALKSAFEGVENPFHATFTEQLETLENVRQSYAESECLLKCLKENEPFPVVKHLMNNSNLAVSAWHEKLLVSQNNIDNARTKEEKTQKTEELKNARQNFAAYVTNLVHLFDMQEKVIKERLALQQGPQQEFQGIDLNTSKELYINYNRMLNEVQTNIRQLDFMVEQLKNPKFEITSMSSIPNDFVTNEMISKASQIVQSMKDQNNRSTKEIERLQDQLNVQKEFLAQHMNQTVLLQKLKEQLIKEKIISLQSVTLGLLRQQISILEKHLQDYIAVRLKDLHQETDLIADHQSELRNEMKELPNKWVEERLIDQQLMINQKMVQDIATLVETKNMETNLEILQAYPQDFAVPPLHPKSQRSLLYAFFGAFAGAFLTFTFFIVRSTLHGIKASVDNLKANHLHVSGSVTERVSHFDEDLLESDLDTLRRMMAYLNASHSKGDSLLILNGAGFDISQHLVNLIGKKGLRTLYMPISFNKSEKAAGKGLIQYLEGVIDQPEIYHEGNHDCIYEGGVSRFAPELIASKRFKNLLAKLKENYDWIVVSSDVMPASGQADGLRQIFDHTVVNISHENIGELKNYMNYKLDIEAAKKVTFIFSCH